MAENRRETLAAEIRRLVEYHRFLGIMTYPRTEGLTTLLNPGMPRKSGPAAHGKESTPGNVSPKAPPAPPVERVSKLTTLPEIRADLGDCKRCALAATRKNIVFGEGAVNAALFLVADGPSPEDDLSGTPFNGEAGALLDKMLAAITLSRKEIYISSLVKCRVPDGRSAATPEEAAACLPFLLRQIETVNPKIVCAMGPLATRTLLGVEHPLIRMRGRFHPLRSGNGGKKTLVLPTFHPAFLLTNPDMKKASWEDLLLIRKELNSL